MNRRLNHNTTKSPAVAGRGPDDLPKCYLRPEWLDALMSASGADEETTEAAQHACGSCPIKAACWAENADEDWLKALTSTKPKRAPRRNTKRSVAWAQRATERIAVLEQHAAAGSSIDDVAAALGITPTSVYTWCGRHNALDLFHQFEGALAVLEARRERHKARGAAA